jgi:hypothetical protein
MSRRTACAVHITAVEGDTACIIFPIAASAESLSPEEAAGHVGETASVCGPVVSADVFASGPAGADSAVAGDFARMQRLNCYMSVLVDHSGPPAFAGRASENPMSDAPLRRSGEPPGDEWRRARARRSMPYHGRK